LIRDFADKDAAIRESAKIGGRPAKKAKKAEETAKSGGSATYDKKGTSQTKKALGMGQSPNVLLISSISLTHRYAFAGMLVR
jgi:hypothetical protein